MWNLDSLVYPRIQPYPTLEQILLSVLAQQIG